MLEEKEFSLMPSICQKIESYFEAEPDSFPEKYQEQEREHYLLIQIGNNY